MRSEWVKTIDQRSISIASFHIRENNLFARRGRILDKTVNNVIGVYALWFRPLVVDKKPKRDEDSEWFDVECVYVVDGTTVFLLGRPLSHHFKYLPNQRQIIADHSCVYTFCPMLVKRNDNCRFFLQKTVWCVMKLKNQSFDLSQGLIVSTTVFVSWDQWDLLLHFLISVSLRY